MFGLVLLALAGFLLQAASTATGADDQDKKKSDEKDKKEEKVITTDSGLKYVDQKEGTGAEAKKDKTVTVHYTGWLKSGKKFDSSKDRDEPFKFKLGAGQVIKGWDEGVAGMKVGGKRKLIIPPELGYGKRGAGRVIPPNAELTFEVELLKVE
jgi:FKBP-type peptidyl-prolyl cis-trans isomerase FkpA